MVVGAVVPPAPPPAVYVRTVADAVVSVPAMVMAAVSCHGPAPSKCMFKTSRTNSLSAVVVNVYGLAELVTVTSSQASVSQTPLVRTPGAHHVLTQL